MNNIIDYRIKKAHKIFYESKNKCIFNRPLIKNIINDTNLFKYDYDHKNLTKIIKDIFDVKEIKLKNIDKENNTLNYLRKSNNNDSKYSNIRIIFYNDKHDALNINSSINYSNIVQFLLISNNISHIKIPLINIDCTRDQVEFLKNITDFNNFKGKYLTIQVSENYNNFESIIKVADKLYKNDIIHIFFFYCHFLFDVSKKYPNVYFNHKIYELEISKLRKKKKIRIFINENNFEFETQYILKISSFRYTNINKNFKNISNDDNINNIYNISKEFKNLFKKFSNLFNLDNKKVDIVDFINNCDLFKNMKKKNLVINKNHEKIKKNSNILSKHKYMENNDTSDISSFDLSTEQIENKNTLDNNNSESSEISDFDLSDSSNEYTKSALDIDHNKTMTNDSSESFSLSSNKSAELISSDSNNSVFVKNSDYKVLNKNKSIFRRKLHTGLTNMSSSVSSKNSRSKRNSSVSSSRRTKNSFVSKQSVNDNGSRIRNVLGAPVQNPYQMNQPQMSNGLPQHLQGVNPLSVNSNSQSMVMSEASQNQAINSISANMLSPQIPQQNASLANSNIPQYLHSQIANRLPTTAQNVIPQNFSGQLPPHMVNQLNLQQPQMMPQQPQMMPQVNQQQILNSLPQGYNGPLPGNMYGGGKKKE